MCETCGYWCDVDFEHRNRTGHHVNCPVWAEKNVKRLRLRLSPELMRDLSELYRQSVLSAPDWMKPIRELMMPCPIEKRPSNPLKGGGMMRVKMFRDAGLEAKWSKTRTGRPYLVARNPKRGGKWFVVNGAMMAQIEKYGVSQGFENATLLGDLFFLPVE